jgi:hypothetical protein
VGSGYNIAQDRAAVEVGLEADKKGDNCMPPGGRIHAEAAVATWKPQVVFRSLSAL